jgi:hypothetical protein
VVLALLIVMAKLLVHLLLDCQSDSMWVLFALAIILAILVDTTVDRVASTTVVLGNSPQELDTIGSTGCCSEAPSTLAFASSALGTGHGTVCWADCERQYR